MGGWKSHLAASIAISWPASLNLQLLQPSEWPLLHLLQVFPPTRVGHRAVQAVEVLAPKKSCPSGNGSQSSINTATPHPGSTSAASAAGLGQQQQQQLQRYTYTFVLELITNGPYRDCWLTVGVRPGNYAV